ncbi:PTS sugar transporter subunit IIA [Xylocopilactobacillus apicola]|uniref:PTS sugar transporter subunit IIA n=2 Tax=Xylocopilactobacillus apicola TaxID=2932184 RepID=A0AAU9DW11_9LACO|nr:PTS sugar transporter subunit IIA [Xylocopilactobacillus apicola]
MMGDGFLVHPNSGSVVAPVAGEITVQQGHALGIKRADGLEFLLHIGIDTVSLKGAPFTQHVGVKDVVNPGDLLVDVDWQQIKDANLDSSVMVIITNTNDLLAQLEVKYGNVSAGAKVGTATAK